MPIMVNVLNPEEFRRVAISDFMEPDTIYPPINTPPKPKPSNYPKVSVPKGTYPHFKLSNNVGTPLNLPIERFSDGTRVLNFPVEGLNYNSKKKPEETVVAQFIIDNLQPQPRPRTWLEQQQAMLRNYIDDSNAKYRAEKAAERLRAKIAAENIRVRPPLKNLARKARVAAEKKNAPIFLSSNSNSNSNSTMLRPSTLAEMKNEPNFMRSNSTMLQPHTPDAPKPDSDYIRPRPTFTTLLPSSPAVEQFEHKRSSSNSTPVKETKQVETKQVEKKLASERLPEDRKDQLIFLEEFDQVESKQETKIDSSRAVVEQASNTTTQVSNAPSISALTEYLYSLPNPDLDLNSDFDLTSDSDSDSDDSL
jgi:hypothetical protein